MSESQTVPTTIAEQIYALMLMELADDDAFDEATVRQINELIEQEKLTNRNAVLKAITVQPGVES